MKKMNFNINNNLMVDEKILDYLKDNNELKDFLIENNLPFDFIYEYPNKLYDYVKQFEICKKCRGLKYCGQDTLGHIFKLEYDGAFNMILTPCKYQLKKLKDEKYLSNFIINDISSSNKNIDIKDIEIDRFNKDILTKAYENIKGIDKIGAYLYGDVGVGKSYICSALANAFAKKGKKVAFVNVSNFYYTVTNLKSNIKLIDDLKDSDLLVLDDIGAETSGSWFRDEVLFNIINARMDENKMTWFTSNEDISTLTNHFNLNNKLQNETLKSRRLIDRILSISTPMILRGQNKRMHN